MGRYIGLHHVRPKSYGTHYYTTQYTPAQLIFGRDVIINRRQEVDQETIRKRKENLINKSNECETEIE